MRTILHRVAVIGFAAAMSWSISDSARAAVLHGTFTGVITGGFDSSSTFGAGTDLTNQTITGHLYLDTAAAPAGTPSGALTNIYENFTGTPWLWGSFTINGVTRNVGPDFRTYESVSSSDFGGSGDFLTFSTNSDVIDNQPTEKLLMRSALDLSLFDIDDIIVPGKDLPSAGFTWTPDNLFDSGTGSFLAFDQVEFLPNGPIETRAFALGDFNLTAVTFQVVDSPASLPLFATAFAALALLHGTHRHRMRYDRPKARA
jgi:hypothetical protein